MNFQRGSLSGCVFAGLLTATWFLSPSFASETASFRLEKSSHGKKLLAPDGRTVFQYMIRKPAVTNLSANSTCCLYPLNTPQGVRVVDLAPGDRFLGGRGEPECALGPRWPARGLSSAEYFGGCASRLPPRGVLDDDRAWGHLLGTIQPQCDRHSR